MINYLRNKCNLLNTVNNLKLQVHNQQQIIDVLEVELNNCNEELVNKKQELSNLNKYTSELELKLNTIKELVK